MERPRIKRTLELLSSAAGDMYVLRPTEDSDLRIEQPDETARALLAALDGTRTVEELERDFGAERVRQALGDLAALGLVDDAADDARVPAPVARSLRPPAPLLRRPRERPARRLGVPAAAARRARGDARRGRPRQLGGLRAGLLRRRRARPARRRPCRGEQLQPPDPLPRARHRPREGRGRRRGARGLQLELPARRRGRGGSRAPRRCARSVGRRGLRRERRGLAGARHRALGERGLLRGRRPVHHDEPLAAGRARGPALRARGDRLLRVPGGDLPRRLPALRRARGAAPRPRRRRPPRSGRCAPSWAARWRSRRSTSSPGSCPPATLGMAPRLRPANDGA